MTNVFQLGLEPPTTLPETNIPLKMDGWNTTFLLGRPIFRGYVSFRECSFFWGWGGRGNGVFSTAIAFGSSAIVKVSGQNCFRTLYGWGRSVLAAKRFRRRFHQGSSSFVASLVVWADPFWGAIWFCGRFPHHFFTLVSQFLNSFLHSSPTALALGSSAIVKILGQMTRLSSGVICSKWPLLGGSSQDL